VIENVLYLSQKLVQNRDITIGDWLIGINAVDGSTIATAF
jgi:hypothetical protein